MQYPQRVSTRSQRRVCSPSSIFFFFNDTATTEIYTLSLHDALPICRDLPGLLAHGPQALARRDGRRSEEHTSELQSPIHLVCRLLLEKKKKERAFCNRRLGRSLIDRACVHLRAH